MLLLLPILMLSFRAQAQSGEVDTDTAPTVSCTSHISLYEGSNITCQLVSKGYDLDDDEDEETDTIEKITACCCELVKKKCVEVLGDTLSSKDLNPISLITLTALSKKGHRIEKTLNLKKIIKPKSPQVYNVTLNQDQALVHVQIPYHKDYLKEDNLHLQLQLWSETTVQTQNMTSSSMNIGLSHLRSGTQYHVKVRAIPWDYFQGTWSEWSQPYTFHTPPGESSESLNFMRWSIIPAVVVVGSVLVLWKNRGILSYMWPSIPHPKTTFERICGPTNGLLLSCIPDKISSLNVYTSVSQSYGPSCSEKDPALYSSGTTESPSCSDQSTDVSMSNSSVGTEELELLSQSSTTEEGQDASDGLSIVNTEPRTEAPETVPTQHKDAQNERQNERDDSYVTMSSFYQIETADKTAPIKPIVT